MRYGFTTGSCAAAAAKAAAYMLLTGREKTKITIETPKGIPYTAQILRICRKEREVSCAVEKDGGDDPDITTGALICAKVSFPEETGRKAGGAPEKETGGKTGTGRRLRRRSCDETGTGSARGKCRHQSRSQRDDRTGSITGVSGAGLLWKSVSGDLCAGGRTSGRADI